MYWGAEDHVRPGVDRRQHRVRLLLTIAVVGIMSVAGTVLMARAATPVPASASTGSPARLTASVGTSPATAPTTTVAKPAAPKPAAPKPAPLEPAVKKPAAPPTTVASHVSGAPESSEQTAVRSALQTRSQTPATSNLASSGGCSAAVSYLTANSAPGFQFECPGYALGHQAMTCINVSGVCPGTKLIVIADACPAAYMNEAHNSWIMAGLRTGSIDPYGYCH
ncbi:MAG TPA: hypothetical protein VG435_17495 [Acidimicrobiales bacterium]|nr:hypothetical protein [Acidimicrobiales bacterium]